MFSKVAVVLALIATVYAGHEAPPPKAVTYNVPSVAKVSYPAPTVTKSVETYSAPSIEKTTTITRTITAPLNAPAVKSVTYNAPSAPVVKAHAPAVYAAPGFGTPNAYYSTQYAQPIAYAHTAPNKGYVAQTLTLAAPQLGYAAPAYAGYAANGINHATVYAAPALGYSLGGAGYIAAAPVAVKGGSSYAQYTAHH